MSVVRWVLIGAMSALTGCASLTSIQRAETLGLGRSEVGLAASGTGGVPTGGNGSAQVYPRFDLVGRTGVTDSVNLGGQFGTIIASSNGTTVLGLDVQAEAKTQLNDRNSPVAISLAPSVGAAFVAGGVTAQAFEFNASLPLLIGVKLGDHELIFGPRVINVLEVATGQGGGTVDLFGVGGSVGFAAQLTPNFNIIPEVAFNVPVVGNVNSVGTSQTTTNFSGFFLTFGVGFLYDWGGGGNAEFHPAHSDTMNPSSLF
jgi:hypothetical protein